MDVDKCVGMENIVGCEYVRECHTLGHHCMAHY